MHRVTAEVPKSAHEALLADQQASGLTVMRMAADYDKCKTWAYDVLNGEMPFALHHIERWAQLTGGRNIMRWMGRVTGHLVAPIPEDVETPEQELPALMRAFGDLVEGTAAALEDGQITRAEAERVWNEGEALIAATYGVMQQFRRRSTRAPFRPRTLAEAGNGDYTTKVTKGTKGAGS